MSNDFLDRLGVNALRWAQEFLVVKAELEREGRSTSDEGAMIAWFANAIEAGRAAGRRETCPHCDIFTLSDDLTCCRTCGKLFDTKSKDVPR